MKRFLRWVYKKLEKWLFDETYAEVDAERTELLLKVEELVDKVDDLEDYINDMDFGPTYE